MDQPLNRRVAAVFVLVAAVCTHASCADSAPSSCAEATQLAQECLGAADAGESCQRFFDLATELCQGVKADWFMDPHLPPDHGPWMEGWYTRVIDANDPARSFAVVGGTHLSPETAYQPGVQLPGYLAIIVSEGNGSVTRVHEAFPAKTLALQDGEAITSVSPLFSPANFEWTAEGLGTITQDYIDVEIPGQVKVQADFWDRLPWRAGSDLGPAQLLDFLPGCPLHWYVYSLGSKTDYILSETSVAGDSSTIVSQGIAHQEKNWGTAFPSAWAWSQGITKGDARFAFSGGKLTYVLPLETWLLGYRSPELQWDFRFDNASFSSEIDACAGRLRLRAESLEAPGISRILTVSAQAPVASFGQVAIPTEEGFRPGGGRESFSATVTLTASRKTLLLGERLLEHRLFENAALEFGGSYRCDHQ